MLPPQHILSYNLITVVNSPLWILHKSCHCGPCWCSHPSWHFSRAARGFLGRGVSCSQSVTLGSLSISSLAVEEFPMERCQPDASPVAGFKDNSLKYRPCCLEDVDFPGRQFILQDNFCLAASTENRPLNKTHLHSVLWALEFHMAAKYFRGK